MSELLDQAQRGGVLLAVLFALGQLGHLAWSVLPPTQRAQVLRAVGDRLAVAGAVLGQLGAGFHAWAAQVDGNRHDGPPAV